MTTETDILDIDITDDMYTGSLHPEIIQDFICMLCYGIVFKPLKCNKCETMYCSKCVPKD